jgi:regulator of protease activity HflC (stomatin/prohibitin superfamily)
MSEADPLSNHGGRFQSGRSGNPNGRPRKSVKSAGGLDDALIDAANEKVAVTVHGKRRRMSKLDAGAKQLANKHAAGDLRATKLLREAARHKEAAQRLDADAVEFSANDQLIVLRLIERIRSFKKES